MTEIIARVATTQIIERNGVRMQFAKEAFDNAVEELDAAAPYVPEHDQFSMTIGKTDRLSVEPFEEGHALIAYTFVDDNPLSSKTSQGDELVLLEFKDRPMPFKRRFDDVEVGQDYVFVDEVNFDGRESHLAFQGELEKLDDAPIPGTIGRLSLVPEPFIQFIQANPELAAFFYGIVVRDGTTLARYLVTEAAKAGKEKLIEVFSKRIRDVLEKYNEHRSEDDRPVVIETDIPGETDIRLLARVEPNEDGVESDIDSLVHEVDRYRDVLQISQEAVFARTDSGDWKFRYSKLNSGGVIGTPECYDETLALHQYLTDESARERGASVGIQIKDAEGCDHSNT